jgi:hypothetical protein
MKDVFQGTTTFPQGPKPTDAEALAKALAEGAIYPPTARENHSIDTVLMEDGRWTCNITQWNDDES